jgi:signal transduction histidine kinase
MDTAALRNHAEAILKAIAHDISQPQTAEQQEAKSKGRGPRRENDSAAETHAGIRQSEGFSLDEMVSEYRALRASVIRLWTRKLPSADREILDEMTRFNEAIDQALTESIARYAERLSRSRELFLGILGHDLRNPLGAVMNSAQYLLHSDGLSGAQTKAVSAISRGGTRIRDMISDLLDVARTRLGEYLPISPAPIDLASTCQQAIEESQAYHPDRVITFSASGDLHGTWDEARLRQMLSNLIQNAIRHGEADTPVVVSAYGKPHEALVSVHNEGTPIPESARKRIFEPLVRGEEDPVDHARPGSIGLGLYIVRAIVQAHGGSIDVESSKENGTTFTARLPKKTAPSARSAPSSRTG